MTVSANNGNSEEFYDIKKEIISTLSKCEINGVMVCKTFYNTRIKNFNSLKKFFKNYKIALKELNSTMIKSKQMNNLYTYNCEDYFIKSDVEELLTSICDILNKDNTPYNFILNSNMVSMSIESMLLALIKCYMLDEGDNFNAIADTLVLKGIQAMDEVNPMSAFKMLKKVVGTLGGGAISFLGLCFIISGDLKVGITLTGIGGSTIGASNKKGKEEKEIPKKKACQDIANRLILYYYIKAYIIIKVLEQKQAFNDFDFESLDFNIEL